MNIKKNIMSTRQSILWHQSTEDARNNAFEIGKKDGQIGRRNFDLYKDGSYKKHAYNNGYTFGAAMADYPNKEKWRSEKKKKDSVYFLGFNEQRILTRDKIAKEFKGKLTKKEVEKILDILERK